MSKVKVDVFSSKIEAVFLVKSMTKSNKQTKKDPVSLFKLS